MIVCHCGPVSDTTIREIVASGAHTADDVGEVCGAGVQCGTCRPVIEHLIHEMLPKVGPAGRESGSAHG